MFIVNTDFFIVLRTSVISVTRLYQLLYSLYSIEYVSVVIARTNEI